MVEAVQKSIIRRRERKRSRQKNIFLLKVMQNLREPKPYVNVPFIGYKLQVFFTTNPLTFTKLHKREKKISNSTWNFRLKLHLAPWTLQNCILVLC